VTFQHVVILGGGPVGLLCANEAKRYFPYVTIVEKRSTYSRTNLPVVDPELRKWAILDDIAVADELARQLKEQEQTAKKCLDYLKPDQGKELPNLDWDETAGALWRSVAETWKKLKELTEGFVLLDSRLKELETLLRVK
jgi:2-polyprenyl-6-methoxyphenol hydroxylase-like FAD-dependent oxidoreductase